MPWVVLKHRKRARRSAHLVGWLAALLLFGPTAQAKSQKSSTLGKLQRALPASTSAIISVPVPANLRESLAMLLPPERPVDSLLDRLSRLSVERTGLDLTSTEVAALFITARGAYGVLLLGDLGSTGLKGGDRRVAGHSAISLSPTWFLAKINGVVALAPRAGIEALSRVARGDGHKLLGTKRLQVFRQASSSLPPDQIAFVALGAWLLPKLSPQVEASVAKGLSVVYGSYRGGHVVMHASGRADSLRYLGGLAEEGVGILRLQQEMLKESQKRSKDVHERVSDAVVVEVLAGVAQSVKLKRGEERMELRFSLPAGLSSSLTSVALPWLLGNRLPIPAP